MSIDCLSSGGVDIYNYNRGQDSDDGDDNQEFD